MYRSLLIFIIMSLCTTRSMTQPIDHPHTVSLPKMICGIALLMTSWQGTHAAPTVVYELKTAQSIHMGCRPNLSWKDSVEVNGRCYCDSNFDHGIGSVKIQTPAGMKTIREVCARIGPPPAGSRKLYNDIQCGNGPANNAGDEDPGCCPGRVDLNGNGCGDKGPKFDLSVFMNEIEPEQNPIFTTTDTATPPPALLPKNADLPKYCQPRPSMQDSVEVNGKCYCSTDYSKNIDKQKIQTPAGEKTLKAVCEKIGPPPAGTQIPYNDIQCGNGPSNGGRDEEPGCCPGRIDIGLQGCDMVGPKFDLSVYKNIDQTSDATPPPAGPDLNVSPQNARVPCTQLCPSICSAICNDM